MPDEITSIKSAAGLLTNENGELNGIAAIKQHEVTQDSEKTTRASGKDLQDTAIFAASSKNSCNATARMNVARSIFSMRGQSMTYRTQNATGGEFNTKDGELNG